LNGYFTAINAADYRTAWELYTPHLRAQIPLEKLSEADSTTQDSDVVIHWVKRTGTRTARAYVTFTSTQDAAHGPDGDTADNWTLDYNLKLVGGLWLIDRVTGHSGSTHTPA
jgi:hypothetical protein